MTKLDTAHRQAVPTGAFAFTEQRKKPLDVDKTHARA